MASKAWFTAGGAGTRAYPVGKEMPVSERVLEWVMEAMALVWWSWTREMWMMEVWRPSLTSVMVKRAGPAWVRRRKSRWRVMGWGWFWEERVLEKWAWAARRKTVVMKPPWGTVREGGS